MKRIKCPHCNKPVLRTIEVEVKGLVLYYLNREQFGEITFPYWANILGKETRKEILRFYCRGCQKPFPKEMNRKIYHWLKMEHLVKKLSQ